MHPSTQQLDGYVARYMVYISEAAGIVLNLFATVLIFVTYCMVRLSYEISKKFKKMLWYLPNRICRSPIFARYYIRMLAFLDEWRLRATCVHDGNTTIRNSPDETAALLEEDIQGKESHDSSGNATLIAVPLPETPKFVIAEVHTHDTPESDNESPHSVRFRTPATTDSPPASRKSLSHELEESQIEDDGSTSTTSQ